MPPLIRQGCDLLVIRPVSDRLKMTLPKGILEAFMGEKAAGMSSWIIGIPV